MDTDPLKKPKATIGDIAHTAAKAGLSGIPLVGSPAAEIFAAIITPPLTKRRDEWVESIVDGLKALEDKVEGFKIEEFSENEVFITTTMHATQAAIRNHQQEKLEALRNAVLNSAQRNAPDEDIQLMFLNLIDTFTPWHLRILKFFDDPVAWAQKNGVSYPSWAMGGPATVLEHAFPELAGRREIYDLLVKDLFENGLFNTQSMHVTMSVQGMLASRTTNLGKSFIEFITSPLSARSD